MPNYLPVTPRKLLLVCGAMVVSACGPVSTSPESGADIESFSERRTPTEIIALIKLTEPPLLQGSKNPFLRNLHRWRIEQQQERFLASLYNAVGDAKNERGLVKVIYRYKFVMNGVTVLFPASLAETIDRLPGVARFSTSENGFERPETVPVESSNLPLNELATSVSWMGATQVHALAHDNQPIRGRGVSVGIIDTGIDYTHAMFGGAGTEEAYSSNNPSVIEPGTFPTERVVGGIDLTGDVWAPGGSTPETRIPIPDPDPLDFGEGGGHGTHVAGSVAGLFVENQTYIGVAPDAKLHAIKVFGTGGTRDYVVIAGLEYAADPNGDGDPSDRLDVVNLSLGRSYGTEHSFYQEAFNNLVKGGTVAVCSAGNSGQTPFLVGQPSTSDACISVAASIDNQEQNWRFPAIGFEIDGSLARIRQFADATFGKPVSTLIPGEGDGEIVDVGLLATDLSPEDAERLQGRIALARRGEVSFQDKAKRAFEAGAKAILIANNQPGELVSMSGDEEVSFPFPVLSILAEDGDRLSAALAAGQTVRAVLSGLPPVEEPWRIDSIAPFSSQGPRSFDALLKPEITAPGYNVVSAAMGSGDKGVALSGTSMSAPHIAGLAALIRQVRPDATSDDIRSLIINSGKDISFRKSEEYQGSCVTESEGANPSCIPYPVSIVGAGRAQAVLAVSNLAVAEPATLSLGILRNTSPRTITKTVWVKNLSPNSLTLNVTTRNNTGISANAPSSITVSPNKKAPLRVRFTIDPSQGTNPVEELDGIVRLTSRDGTTQLQIPFLAELVRPSQIRAQGSVYSGSLTLTNTGDNPGSAIPFNLVARDAWSLDNSLRQRKATPCDLESVGYRTIERKNEEDDSTVRILQVAFKLAKPITHWQLCEPSVMMDINGDKKPDRELHTIFVEKYGRFLSKFVDYQKNAAAASEEEETAAILDVQLAHVVDFSTLALVEVNLDAIGARGPIAIQAAMQNYIENITEYDDFLGKDDSQWYTINLDTQPFSDLPEEVTLEPGATETISFTRAGRGQLIVYYPRNAVHGGLLPFAGLQAQIFGSP